jgi:hypothetical protein
MYTFFYLDALLADLQSTIQQTNKLNGSVNGGYGSINNIRSRLPSNGSPVPQSPVQPPEYATVRTHKIERSTSNPAVRQELSVTYIIYVYNCIKKYIRYLIKNIFLLFINYYLLVFISCLKKKN